VTNSPKSFFLGVGDSLSRSQYPSAHNYYLDFIYNFGALALFPMLFLMGLTITQIYSHRREVFASPVLLGLCLVTLFLLIADNSLKVGLRQPYPGIFTFFLWGILLSELFKLSSIKNNKDDALLK
jgi:O-antigen ligase